MTSRNLIHGLFSVFGSMQISQRRAKSQGLETSLTPAEVTTLKEDGFLSISADQRFDFLNTAIDEANRIIDGTSTFTTKDKSYMKNDFISGEKLAPDSVFTKLALDPKLLSIASAYFGYLPVLSHISVIQSRNVNDKSPEDFNSLTSSQLFHLDHADVKQLKVFIYCNDVTKASGPFSLINSRDSKKLISKINYSLRPEKYRVTDDVVKKHLPQTPIVQFIRPKGTIIFADTSQCFHFGSRVEQGTHERRVILIQYVSPFSFIKNRKGNAYLPNSSFMNEKRNDELVKLLLPQQAQ